jgi:ABC-type antimicrobial peptide transport system permease subunit
MGLADSVQTISTITGSLAEGYNLLSGTFNVQQNRIADSFNFASDLEALKSIAESEKEQVRLMQEERKRAMEDAKKQKSFFYISTAIAIVAVIVAVVTVIVTMLI